VVEFEQIYAPMNLSLDYSISTDYKSSSQKARVVTEAWVKGNLYCPVCGNPAIKQYAANKPVADFYCENCSTDFELKSKEVKKTQNLMAVRIVDGAYGTMIERITAQNNPNLLYMLHDSMAVTDLLLIPKFFFVPSMIEKRPPLKATARRAGWIGCNINLSGVPSVGKIPIISNSQISTPQTVAEQYAKAQPLQTDNIVSRGWIMDVLLCVERLGQSFVLNDVYAFENELIAKHPQNKYVKDKMRQQLQILRDKRIIEFSGRGVYRKVV
jgi:type II restriction enzyme